MPSFKSIRGGAAMGHRSDPGIRGQAAAFTATAFHHRAVVLKVKRGVVAFGAAIECLSLSLHSESPEAFSCRR